MIYDSELNPADQAPLLESRASLEASIALEGKPAAGEIPENITGSLVVVLQTFYFGKLPLFLLIRASREYYVPGIGGVSGNF